MEYFKLKSVKTPLIIDLPHVANYGEVQKINVLAYFNMFACREARARDIATTFFI